MYATRDPERYDLSVQAKESGLLIGQLATYTKSFAYIQSHCPKLSVRRRLATELGGTVRLAR